MTGLGQHIARKLTAILAADVTGYSRLMGRDEEGTLARLDECRRSVIEPKVAAHRGRIFKTTGDGLLAEFSSVVDAVRCAVEIQQAMAELNRPLPADRRMDFRVGINLGDVMMVEDDIYGDGVNVAARIEGLAEPGGICLSKTVVDHIQDKLDLALQDLGERHVKNIARPVRVFRVLLDGVPARPPPALQPAASRPLPGGRRSAFLASALALAVVGAAVLWHVAGRAPAPTPAPGGPSVAVLPFDVFGADPQLTPLAAGIGQDILTQLDQVSGLTVVSPGAAAGSRDAGADIPGTGRRLGVRYLLQGSLRPAGDQVRLSVRLVDATRGEDVWGARYDLAARDPLASEDSMVESLTTEVLVRMRNRDLQDARATPADRLGPYGFYLLGKEALARDDLRGIKVAAAMFDRALALDSGYAPALAGRALVALRELKLGLGAGSMAASLGRIFDLAEKALALSPGVADAQQVAGEVYLYRRQYDQAIDLLRGGIEATADDTGLREALADVYVYAGEASRGLAELDRLMRLDPFHGQAVFAIHARGDILVDQGEQAIRNAELCMARAPEYRPCFDAAGVAYVEGARLEQAREAVERSRSLDPSLTLAILADVLPFRKAQDLKRFQTALAAAGLR